MANLTSADIRAHLDSLVGPAGNLDELRDIAERLCLLQQTLTPVATPRRLVLFASERGYSVASNSATAVLAKLTHTDLAVVDATAPDAGQKEAERAHADGMKLVAADAIGDESGAIAEFNAKCAELGLTVLAERGAALLTFQKCDAAAAILARVVPQNASPSRAKTARKVAIFTGSFDPPTTYHRRVATLLRERGFDEVIVRPAGPRSDQPETEHAKPIHRAVLADLAFRDIPGVTVDLSDIDDAVFTPNIAFDDLLADRGEVWQVISSEFVAGGRSGESAIHSKWECGTDVWANSRFVVLHPTATPPDPADLPPVCKLVAVDGHVPTEDIRLRVFQGGKSKPDVTDSVEEYIRRYRLFTGMTVPRETRVRLRDLRLKIVVADRNKKAVELAEAFRKFESNEPTHILVLGGDGTMLQAIRDFWRWRLPFIGLNAGTLGFLMNESLPAELPGAEVLLYRMPMMRVDAEMTDGKRTQTLAFADAWVERDSGQAAWLKIDVDGKTQVPRVVGDGLLVATPAGSSAYARAMGATSVPLTAPVFTLAGSNVFRPRFWKPVALPEGARVALTSLDHNGKRPIRGFIDGQPIGAVKAMHVRVSTIAMVELGFTPEFDLSARLLRSMFPPSDAL